MEKKRVLLVEDDQLTVKLYTKLLKAWGYEVQYAYDGYIALQMIDKQVYDLLLTDYHLPFMTGLELIEKASQTNPQLETIVLTGESLDKLSTNTGLRILNKPIMPDYLRFEISNSLAVQSLRNSA